jgi:hypothetical protein
MVEGSNLSAGTMRIGALPQAIMHRTTAILAAAAALPLLVGPVGAQDLSPAEIVALRFPQEWSPVPVMPLLVTQGRNFEKRPADSPPLHSYSTSALPGLPHPVTDVAKETRPYADPAARDAFFNEGQIIGIRERLNLTREQERHWPAVERALRGVAFRKTRDGAKALDPGSVERLQVAAREFVKHLNEAQKREVQLLANVVGLANQL